MSFGLDNPTNPTNPTQSQGTGENFSSGTSGGSNESYSKTIDYGSDVWGPQQEFLKDLYARAQGQSLDTTNQQYAQSMLGLGEAGVRDFMQPGRNPMLDVRAQELRQSLNEQILPSVRSQASGLQQRGGARQGIAEGLATARTGQQLQNFQAELYNQDRNRALTAMQGIPTLANFGLGIPWYNLQQYGGLIGRPAFQDLGGESESYSSGSNFGETSSYGYQLSDSYGGGGGGGGGGFNFGI